VQEKAEAMCLPVRGTEWGRLQGCLLCGDVPAGADGGVMLAAVTCSEQNT